MKRKVDLDSEVAAATGVAKKKVSRITDAFIDAIRGHLTDGVVVHLDGFGKLRVQEQDYGVRQPVQNLTIPKGERAGEPVAVPVKHKVHFTKARPFKHQLQQRWERDKAMVTTRTEMEQTTPEGKADAKVRS